MPNNRKIKKNRGGKFWRGLIYHLENDIVQPQRQRIIRKSRVKRKIQNDYLMLTKRLTELIDEMMHTITE